MVNLSNATMPSADQAATHRRSVRLQKLLGTLGDGARTASEEAATDSKKRQFNGANVATFSKKTYSKLNSTTDLVIGLLEASAGEGEHLEVETTADEDLVCPIHLKRPSQCPQGVYPAPLGPPPIGKPRLLPIQICDVLTEANVCDSGLFHTMRTQLQEIVIGKIDIVLLPLKRFDVWRLVIFMLDGMSCTTHIYAPEVSHKDRWLDLEDILRRCLRVIFRKKEGRVVAWDRLIGREIFGKSGSKNAQQILRPWTQILEKLAKRRGFFENSTTRAKSRAAVIELLQSLELPKPHLQITHSNAAKPLEISENTGSDATKSICSDSEDDDDEHHDGKVRQKMQYRNTDVETKSTQALRCQFDQDDESLDHDAFHFNEDEHELHDKTNQEESNNENDSSSRLDEDEDGDADFEHFFDEESIYGNDSISDVDGYSDLGMGDTSLEYVGDNDISKGYGDFSKIGNCNPSGKTDQVRPLEDSTANLVSMENSDLEQQATNLHHVSESPYDRALRLIGQQKYERLVLTQAQCDKMLSLRGDTPSLNELSEQVRAEVEKSLRNFRAWLTKLVHRIFDYSCGMILPERHFEIPFDAGNRDWYIANSVPESRQRILDLLFDPRITPYESQIIRGQDCWDTQAMNQATPLPLQDLFRFEQVWGAYSLDLTIRDLNGRTPAFRYTGSSIGGTPKNRILGVYSRIVNGHERIADLLQKGGDSETARLRSEGKAHFVHEISALPGTRRSYHTTVLLPVVKETSILQYQVKKLAYFCENAIMIYDCSVDENVKGDSAQCRHAGMLGKFLRPVEIPRPRWYGTNRCLPITAECRIFFSFVTEKDTLVQAISDHVPHMRHSYLQEEDYEAIGAAYSKLDPSVHISRDRVQRAFRNFLLEQGQTMITRQERKMLSYFPMLIAVKEYVTARGLITRDPSDKDRYVISRLTQSDWETISFRARELEPVRPSEQDSAKWYRERWRRSKRGILHMVRDKENWDQITGPEVELKNYDITKDSRGRRHRIPRPLSLKVFTRVVEQLSIDDAENGSVLQTIKEHTRFTAQHIKNVMWRVRTEITESEWKSWSTVPDSPPSCVLSKEISEDEFQKLFEYNDLAALNAENVQPDQNEPHPNFESVRQSCIAAAVRELQQQKTSLRPDYNDSKGIQKRVEDLNTLKPNCKIRAFRLFNQEREEAARDREVLFQSMRKVTMHPRLSGLDQKRKDIELARAAMIRCVKRWDIQTPPGQDSKYGMYHETWRNVRASLARLISKDAQSLRHLCQATTDQTKTMYFLCFRLYDDACCRSFDEKTTFVKNAVAQLWKKKLLHLYFYQCPAAWDTVSLRDIIANICKPEQRQTTDSTYTPSSRAFFHPFRTCHASTRCRF